MHQSLTLCCHFSDTCEAVQGQQVFSKTLQVTTEADTCGGNLLPAVLQGEVSQPGEMAAPAPNLRNGLQNPLICHGENRLTSDTGEGKCKGAL